MRDFTPGHKIKAAWHSISRMYNSYASQSQLTIPIAYVLLLLSSKKGTLSTQVAPLLGMEAGSITRLLPSKKLDTFLSVLDEIVQIAENNHYK